MNKEIMTMSPADLDKITEQFESILDDTLYRMQQKHRLVDIGEMLRCGKSSAGNYINVHTLPVKRLALLVLAADDNAIVEFQAELKKKILVDRPEPGKIMHKVGNVCSEAADVIKAVADSVAGRRMTNEKVRKIRKEMNKLIAAVESAIVEATAMGVKP